MGLLQLVSALLLFAYWLVEKMEAPSIRLHPTHHKNWEFTARDAEDDDLCSARPLVPVFAAALIPSLVGASFGGLWCPLRPGDSLQLWLPIS